MQKVDSKNDSNEVLNILLGQNKMTLNAADGTTFTTGPLADMLGAYGEGPGAGQILNGTADLSGLEKFEEIREWIKDLQHNQATRVAPPICLGVTTDEWHTVVRPIKERKTSSLFGRHYGHYKAVLKSDDVVEF